MALRKFPPNTILLGGGLPGGDGGHTIVNEFVAGVEITPGMLIEFYVDGTTTKLRPHSVAGNVAAPMVALEKIFHNKTVDDVYKVNELVHAAHLRNGSTWWALVASGQDITSGELLQSNGDGMLKSATAPTAAADVAKFQAYETIGAVVAPTRLRTIVL